jgi:protein tyrosine phosphatase
VNNLEEPKMQSPLAEANPESLQEIFDKDPLSLTDDNIEQVVQELRAQRDKWELAEKKTKAKAQVVSNISLEDLGL